MKQAVTSFFFGMLIAAHAQLGGRPGYPGSAAQKESTLYHQTAARYNGAFVAIGQRAADLSQSLGANNAEASQLLTNLAANAEFLRGKWEEWRRKNSSSEKGGYGAGSNNPRFDSYLKGLEADVDALKLAAKEREPEKALASLRDVAIDLRIKADNCRNSADGLGRVIRVKVRTKASEKEAPGYEVWFVAKARLETKSAHDRFYKQSSPTDQRDLSPGRYAFWARKGNYRSEPVTIGVGGKGKEEIEIDLEVTP